MYCVLFLDFQSDQKLKYKNELKLNFYIYLVYCNIKKYLFAFGKTHVKIIIKGIVCVKLDKYCVFLFIGFILFVQDELNSYRLNL